MKSRLFVLSLSLLIVGAGARPVCAKSAGEYAGDLKDYVLSPLHWDEADWRWAGASAVGIAASYTLDNKVRDHFAKGASLTASDPHSTRDAAPLAVLLVGGFALGKLSADKKLSNLGIDMGEAVVLSTLSASAFKAIAGRQRPNKSASHSRFGSGGDSFPSGHVTAVFAAAQVFADRMPREDWGWRALAYGLAGATAYMRLDGNVHWFSDTIAGAALGIASGRFVAGRDRDPQSRVAYSVVPMDHGALLSFNVRLE